MGLSSAALERHSWDAGATDRLELELLRPYSACARAIVRSNYEEQADAYGRYRSHNDALLRELVSGGRLTQGSRVLEIGAGTGDYIAALRRLVGSDCSAVEPARAMREVLLARGTDVRVKAGSAEELPFEARDFDFAFAVQVIHHVADRERFFAEAFRVLDERGTLCVVTESHEQIRARTTHAEYFPESNAADIARYPTIDELERMARLAGFHDIRRTTLDFSRLLTSASSFEAKAYSSLHFVPEAAFEAGLRRLQADLARGPLTESGGYTLLWATK